MQFLKYTQYIIQSTYKIRCNIISIYLLPRGCNKIVASTKRKRTRFDSVLWKNIKPLYQQKFNNQLTTQKRHQKFRLHNECGVRVKTFMCVIISSHVLKWCLWTINVLLSIMCAQKRPNNILRKWKSANLHLFRHLLRSFGPGLLSISVHLPSPSFLLPCRNRHSWSLSPHCSYLHLEIRKALTARPFRLFWVDKWHQVVKQPGRTPFPKPAFSCRPMMYQRWWNIASEGARVRKKY